MSNLEKINIFVPKEVDNILRYDARVFEILKKDGNTINMNRFLSMLICGYHEQYVEECNRKINTIKAELTTKGISESDSDEIADNILKKAVLPYNPSKRSKNTAKLSLKPTNDTEDIILHVIEKESDYISQYFCRMLASYSKKSLSVREQIVFKDNYDSLTRACKNGISVVFRTTGGGDKLHEVLPYKVVASNDGLFNYLLCAEESFNGVQEAITYRLNRFKGITFSKRSISIDPTVKYHLDQMSLLAPQFAINEDLDISVKLTSYGIRRYNRVYYGRPQFSSIEENENGAIYHFNCSEDQVYFYFRRFEGDSAEILSPKKLRERMRESFEESFRVYDGE